MKTSKNDSAFIAKTDKTLTIKTAKTLVTNLIFMDDGSTGNNSRLKVTYTFINIELVSIEIAPEDIAAQAVPRAVSTDLKKVELLPISKDWRTSGDVSSIKDQGSCGCCWSFTTVGLYESWMMVKGEQEYDLSEEYLLECTSKYTQNVLRQNYNSTCNGGYVDFSG